MELKKNLMGSDHSPTQNFDFMNKLFLFIFLVLAGASNRSCSSGHTTEENIVLIDRYVTAVENKDVELMASLLHDDYKGYGPSVTDSTDKAQALESWKYLAEEYYEQIKYDALQNIAVTIDDGPQKGDWVSNWALLSLRFKDGRGPVKLYVNVVYRIENGQIIHSRTFYNEADVLRQLGYYLN